MMRGGGLGGKNRNVRAGQGARFQGWWRRHEKVGDSRPLIRLPDGPQERVWRHTTFDWQMYI